MNKNEDLLLHQGITIKLQFSTIVFLVWDANTAHPHLIMSLFFYFVHKKESSNGNSNYFETESGLMADE